MKKCQFCGKGLLGKQRRFCSDSCTDKYYKAYNKAYYQRPDARAKQKAYRQRPDARAKQKAYQQRPDVKAKQKAYYQRHADEIKAKQKAYYQRHADEIKAKQKAYRQRPDIKAKQKDRRKQRLRELTKNAAGIFAFVTSDGIASPGWRVANRKRSGDKMTITYRNKFGPGSKTQEIDVAGMNEKWKEAKK